MKTLVLGASGMAGHVISLYLQESGFDVETLAANVPFDNSTHLIDVTDITKLKAFLATNKFDAVINCIALLVKQSEDQKDLAVYLNSYLPHFLENFYKDTKTKVIHISTDDVFSFDNPPYQENSLYDGQTFYGRSKALGEIINYKDLTFRTSIVGPSIAKNGTGLFNWFQTQTGEITGYTNAIWNGVTTFELAKGIKTALNQNISGLYNFVPSESISKFQLLELFKHVFSREDIEIKPSEGDSVDKTLLNTRKDFDYKVPSYKTMISEMKTWINDHSGIYRHYGKY